MKRNDNCRRNGGRSGNRTGIALLMTLAMIVLITIVVLTFFTHAMSNRQVEFSRTNRVEATILAQSGLDYVTGLLQQEIVSAGNNSAVTTTGGVIIYTPKPQNAVPQRLLSAGVSMTSANFYNLIRQSVTTADANASADNTSTAARTGRIISAARWNQPQLLASTGFTSTSQLPCWIYVTRTGGFTKTPSADVIGRVAYNVYEIGGLFDINVAGYPSVLSAAQIAQLKSTVAGADLTQLVTTSQRAGLKGDIDNLIKFRNPGAIKSGALDAPTYLDLVASSQRGGFLAPTVTSVVNSATTYTNMPFVNRQDFLSYVRSIKSVDANSYTRLNSIVPYLTQFSRSVNAPTYKPSNPPGLPSPNPNGYDYASHAGNSAYSNRDLPNVRFANAAAATITHYHDNGTTESYTVNAGDPLIQRRWSLARIAWLTPTGPATIVSDGKAIQACYGLVWNNTQDRWDYVGPSGTTAQSTIETLDQVAAETTPREPNFFELLKAGILSGSIGSGNLSDPNYPALPTFVVDDSTFQKNPDIQILKIGANIIDCADTDNYPTILALSFGGTPLEVAGTEDLPYIYSLDLSNMRLTSGTPTTSPVNMTACDVVCIPEFINPHRIPPQGVSGTGPASVTLTVPSGVVTTLGASSSNGAQIPSGGPWNVGWTSPKWPSKTGLAISLPSLATVKPGITIASTAFPGFRSSPQPNYNSGAVNRLSKLVSYATNSASLPNQKNAQGFLLFSYENPIYDPVDTMSSANAWPTYVGESSSGYTPWIKATNMTFDLQYTTPAHNLTKTYASVGGRDGFLSTTGLSGYAIYSPLCFPMTPNQGTGTVTTIDDNGAKKAASGPLYPWDSRSQRFGVGDGFYRNPGNPPDSPSLAAQKFFENIHSGMPFYFGSNNSVDILDFAISGWMRGSKTPTPVPAVPVYPNPPQYFYDCNMKDPDGLMRPADGWLDQLGQNTSGGLANAYLQYDSSGTNLDPNAAARPVILQRPFQSVGELGYVFRDVPGKTLNFFDETSGDSGLLDLFSTEDQPAFVAGRVNLNSLQSKVQASLLSQTAFEPDGTAPLAATSASSVAGLYNTLAYSGGVALATMPVNASQLVNFITSPVAANNTSDPLANVLSGTPTDWLIKYHREAVIRGLAESTQTRTWNVLIDVIAQSGRFPSQNASTTAGDFVVEGESRQWLSIAIDRYTGKVVDQQRETVNE